MYLITFTRLQQYKDYDYKCLLNGDEAVDQLFTFPKQRGSVRVAAIGDIDWEIGNVTAKYIVDNSDNYDAVIAAGDYAYDMCNFGNNFMEDMMDLTSTLPFMVTAGNHEGNSHCGNAQNKSDWVDYYNRFNMPLKKPGNMNWWFSFDIGNVHFVSITTELFLMGSKSSNASSLVVFPMAAGLGEPATILNNMLKWLDADLASTHKKWKVIYFHRPYYTNFWQPSRGPSKNDKNQKAASVIGPLLEPLVLKYNVDLVVQADVHGSERLQPMRNGKIVGNHAQHGHSRYHNVGAPIYLVCGNAGEKGNPVGVDYAPRSQDIFKDASVWVNDKNHGFCDLTFTEDSISYNFVNTDTGPGHSAGDVLDSFVLTKSHRRLKH